MSLNFTFINFSNTFHVLLIFWKEIIKRDVRIKTYFNKMVNERSYEIS